MHYNETNQRALRFLSLDMVAKAQSGHQGMPLGMADLALVLWTKFLKHNPQNPNWFNRDRFVLSNGHGSALLYALLHLTGYDLSLHDLQQFRQLNSKTPGHPECTHTPGVDTTTGPLGQGLANAVGMALAEKTLAAQYNTDTLKIIDHYTYAFAGDGCLMEGISHEACSFAGTFGLGKLIVFYDDNGISIDGAVERWFTDDTAQRFLAYHWHVVGPIDGHDPIAIEQAIVQARNETRAPSIIICKTTIGQGCRFAGQEKVHGAPMTLHEIEQLRQNMGWDYPPFEIPASVYHDLNHHHTGRVHEQAWLTDCLRYQQDHPAAYDEFLRRIQGEFPVDWMDETQRFLETCRKNPSAMATRNASQYCLEHFAQALPELLGGSADLTASNNTNWSGTRAITAQDCSGNYVHYGVREFAMCAIMNGLSLHGGFIPYGGTFLVFADYAKPAIRLSALMKKRVIFILTHDSIGVGEDGPTHQPIEQIAMLRLTPDLNVWRPADLVETAVAWQQAIERQDGPSCLLLSRQTLPAQVHSEFSVQQIQRGGYILYDSPTPPQLIIIATGSEVQIAMACVDYCQKNHIALRVVSMPCIERFLAQENAYQELVLPTKVRKRIAIEASTSDYWYRFVGLDGCIIGMTQFGTSAPAQEAFLYFQITVEHTIAAIINLFSHTKEIHYDNTCCN